MLYSNLLFSAVYTNTKVNFTLKEYLQKNTKNVTNELSLKEYLNSNDTDRNYHFLAWFDPVNDSPNSLTFIRINDEVFYVDELFYYSGFLIQFGEENPTTKAQKGLKLVDAILENLEIASFFKNNESILRAIHYSTANI